MRSLLVSLGGGRYPHSPKSRHDAFAPSSAAVAATLTGECLGLVVADDHCLLFNDDASWPDQLRRIRDWLKAKADEQIGVSCIFIHYVGHGFFKANSEEYFLSINSTDDELRSETSAALGALSRVLRKHAPRARVYYLIDACFAASAIKDLMAHGGEDLVRAKVASALDPGNGEDEPIGGFAALCSSSAIEPSSAAGHRGLTQFTDGLISILEDGDTSTPSPLSLQRVAVLLRARLRQRYDDKAIPPVLHAPQGVNGGIGGFPLFPNRHKSDLDALSAELDEEVRRLLQEKVGVFVEELLSQTSSTEIQKRLDAMRAMGRKEIAEASPSQRFQSSNFDFMPDLALSASRLEALIKKRAGSAGGLQFFSFKPRHSRELAQLREIDLPEQIHSGARSLQTLKDELLMDNAALNAEVANLEIAHSRLVQMAVLSMTMQNSLATKVKDLDVRSGKLETVRKAEKISSERVEELLSFKARIEKTSEVLISVREGNFDRIKIIDRSAYDLMEVVRATRSLLRSHNGDQNAKDLLDSVLDQVRKAVATFDKIGLISRPIPR